MNWQVQSIILISELAAGAVLFRFFIPFFRRVKTGRFDLYIGDRFKKDGSEPKFAGLVMALVMLIGIVITIVGMRSSEELSGSREALTQGYIAAAAVVLLITATGLTDDYNKETKRDKKKKKSVVVIIELVVCLGFSYILTKTGMADTKLLLPFHIGNVELGFIFYPLTAVLMTVIINLTELHDCPGGVTEYGCDGLCAMTAMMFSLACAGACAMYRWLEMPQMLAVITAGCCSAYMIFGISPAKMYLGQSGSRFLGAMLAVITVTTNMPLVFLCSGIVLVAEGVCTLVGHLVFRHKKQLLFKGLTLHGHLRSRGWGDYRIMAVSSVVTLIGSAGLFAYASYADGIIIR